MNGVPEKSETRHFKTKSHNLSIAAIEAAQRELEYAPSGARPAASAGAGVVAAAADEDVGLDGGDSDRLLLLLLMIILGAAP